MPQRRVQGHKIHAPPPPPVSRAVVKRSRGKGRGVFAAAESAGISAHQLVAYYPAKVIRDPGRNSGHPLQAYFVEVAGDDTLVAVPFSEPAYRPPRRSIPFNGWFVNEGKCRLAYRVAALLHRS
jgi:hypothetical protein